jgi:hypothetical protein
MLEAMTQSFKPFFNTGRSKLARFLAGPVAAEPRPVVVPDDLKIHLSGAQYDPATGHLDYLWFDLSEHMPDGERRS